MILRVMRGRGDKSAVASLRRALDAVDTSETESGRLERVHLGWRRHEDADGDAGAAAEDRDVVVLSHWSSNEAAVRADAAGKSPLVFVRQLLRDVEVRHFEVDETIRRQSRDEPVAIRIATGRFSKPGADAEMQSLLRQRAPLIGDDMAEAWVGRRFAGRDVEVTFVSAWRRVSADLPLEETFWPDIALRYDDFAVEVYSAAGVE